MIFYCPTSIGNRKYVHKHNIQHNGAINANKMHIKVREGFEIGRNKRADDIQRNDSTLIEIHKAI